jgi:biotin carboxyl carrier protein
LPSGQQDPTRSLVMRMLRHPRQKTDRPIRTTNLQTSEESSGADEQLPGLGEMPLFRDEAVREHTKSHAAEGDLVRLSPRWANIAYWFLAATFAIAVIVMVFGRVHEYATGTAVVRLADQTQLSTSTPGVVAIVEVGTGERVREGQILVRFTSVDEQSMVEKLKVDFDHELIALLRNPDDPTARAAVGRVRSELDLAQSRLEQRLLRAPVDGTVFDVRVRPGLLVNPGEPVVSVLQNDRKHELVALMPGRYGPRLHPNQGLVFRVTGYADAQVKLVIESVGDGVIGPSEVRRLLGPEIGDAILVSQPVIVVHAILTESTFESEGQSHPYCSGLLGQAEVCVGNQRILFSLLPWTKSLWERWNG